MANSKFILGAKLRIVKFPDDLRGMNPAYYYFTAAGVMTHSLYKINDVITVKKIAKGGDGNWWYKDNEADYIREDCLDFEMVYDEHQWI